MSAFFSRPFYSGGIVSISYSSNFNNYSREATLSIKIAMNLCRRRPKKTRYKARHQKPFTTAPTILTIPTCTYTLQDWMVWCTIRADCSCSYYLSTFSTRIQRWKGVGHFCKVVTVGNVKSLCSVFPLDVIGLYCHFIYEEDHSSRLMSQLRVTAVSLNRTKC